jgi:hypothetical protein
VPRGPGQVTDELIVVCGEEPFGVSSHAYH